MGIGNDKATTVQPQYYVRISQIDGQLGLEAHIPVKK